MKYYVRQIKPYIDPPALHGCNCIPDPVDGYDWVPEDMEEELRDEIVVTDPWSKLIFKERFVETKEYKTNEINLKPCLFCDKENLFERWNARK